MKHPIGQSRNNTAVYVDLIHSSAAKHIAEQPHLLALIAEAIHKTSLRGPIITLEYDMGRPVGYDFVIKTSTTDMVFYAQPVRARSFTRFIKNGEPNATQYITLLLHADKDKTYCLDDAWVGRLRPPQPGTETETSESKPYWAEHAFVLSSQALQTQTITKTCPY